MSAAHAPESSAPLRAGLALVTKRELLASPVDAFFGLHPGDRALVRAGEAIGRGQPIIEQYRDPRTIVVAGSVSDDGPGAPGERWAEAPGRHVREGEGSPGGELLFRSGDAGGSPAAIVRTRSRRRSRGSLKRSAPAPV